MSIPISTEEPQERAVLVGAPIKGSVSVDPGGYPLIYCGQGIGTVGGRSVRIGLRVFSLIDQKMLFFLNGRDELRTRNWYAFDASPLIDGGFDACAYCEHKAVCGFDRFAAQPRRKRGAGAAEEGNAADDAQD